jgi:hypothetical protein
VGLALSGRLEAEVAACFRIARERSEDVGHVRSNVDPTNRLTDLGELERMTQANTLIGFMEVPSVGMTRGSYKGIRNAEGAISVTR